MKTFNEKKYRIGVVLSGGSVRGSAHVGFLQRLDELGYSPEIISGTSAGAMIGAFYAAGKTVEEILDFFRSTSLFQYTSINPLTSGIFDTKKYMSIFEKFLPPTFEDLDLPLTICATNVETGEPQYFNSGQLYKPLLASCTIPVLFAPVEIDGELFIDGGVTDNFPVEQIEDKCENVIGSYLGKPKHVERKEVNSKLKITIRANLLLMHSAVHHKFDKTRITLEYPLQKYGYFDQKKMDELYEVGYEYTKDNLSAKLLKEEMNHLV